MISFINKFNPKVGNIGLFLSDGLHLGSNKGVPSSIAQKIKSFLNKVPKSNKRTVLSFDLSEIKSVFL